MAINLQKGQRVDLTKGNVGLDHISVGLGWDPVQQGIFTANSHAHNIDCDATVFMLQSDRLQSVDDIVYFGNLSSSCRSIQHSGDNLTGDGEGDDEVIVVKLSAVPARYNKLVFLVNIYEALPRQQHFGMIENAFIRVFDNRTGRELVRYNLTENYAYATTLICGEIYRHNTEWKFAAIGTATDDASIGEVATRYQTSI